MNIIAAISKKVKRNRIKQHVFGKNSNIAQEIIKNIVRVCEYFLKKLLTKEKIYVKLYLALGETEC